MSITTVPSKKVILLLAAVLASLASAQGNAADAVTVRLTDGTTLTAELHPRTDDEHLWLRFGSGRAVILRAVAWERVAEATSGDGPIEAAALRQLAAAQVEADEAAAPAEPPPAAEQTDAEQTDAERARELLGFRPRVAAVDFDARIANWDQDVEFDGILLRLFPLDANGQVTSARGTLNVELIAARRSDYDAAPTSRGMLTGRLGQWSVNVNADEVTENGVVLKLPFQTNHPEFDTTWATHGLVHVRFVVPGQGTFEDSYDGVRVRPFAPLRDALERHNQPRFLPTEQTGVRKPNR